MSDKELIKKEIGRRIEMYKGLKPVGDQFYLGQISAAKGILNFIDSLLEEPKCIYNRTLEERKGFCKYCSAYCNARIEEPASEDLEEEIGYYTTSKLLKKRDNSTGIYHLTQKECDNIARHFTEWQKQHMKEALQTEYEKGRFDMMEKMMKDAVDAQVFQAHDIDKAYEGYVYIVSNQFKDLNLLPPNKVKIIIIKSEQQ